MDRQWYKQILWRAGLALLMLVLGTAVFTRAASNPGFLDQNTSDVPAGTKTYRIWYTVDCNDGADCECDNALDLDTDDPPDGAPDEDSPNDCIATVDGDVNGIFDTGPDDDNDGVLNVMDLDWFGGGAGVVESTPRNVQRSVNRYVNDWGLKDPKWDSDTNRNIYVYDIEYLGLASGDGSGELLDTAWMLTQAPEPRGTVLHELWHNTQYAYGVSAGNWLMEGQARMLQDKVFDDLDNRVGSRYHNSIAAYLGNTTYVNWEDRDDDGVNEFAQADGLLGASYNASLWWTYIADQAGAEFVGTAGEGIDALEAVLEQADDDGRQGIDAVSHVLNDRIGQGFDDTFWDFTVANYAKDFDLKELDHSYLGGRDPQQVLTYSDEKRTDPDMLIYGYNDDTLGWINGPERQRFTGADLFAGVNGHVDAMDPDVSDPDAMSEYGANYYEAMVSADCQLIYWRVIGDPGAEFMHSWMMIQEDSNGDTVEEVVSLLRSAGGDFARAAWNYRSASGGPAYSRMVGIVATGGHAYGYDWELGCTQPSVEIIAPTTANPTYVGEPTDPGRFLLWLQVTGDVGTSTYVAGLEWSRDFTVTVGSDVAEILNGGYVQNQYWLVVQAPDKPAASLGDKFDVTVQLGPVVGISDTEIDAVIYDLFTTDQVLVIDRSGSMGDNDKLVSAKTAARLFADVVQKFDKLGVVSFTDDAEDVFLLTDVPDQDDAAKVRENAQIAIDGIGLGNLTSIGDGLQKGQDQLDDWGNLDHQWAMVLLSDGMENEPAFWTGVKAGIVAAGTKVHAIALGRDADEELMRDIAESTCGAVWVDQCYHYIEESGVLAASPNAPAATQLPNALADIYRRSRETLAGQQRLWEDNGALSGDETLFVDIAEDGARHAFFSFNWNDPTAPLNVSISGGGVSFIQLDDGQNHVTFYAEKLPPGAYQIDLSASGGTSEWIGSLSGWLVHGTEMHAFMDNTQLERSVGLPVRLQASLTDHLGPVAGATVRATVTHPELGVEVVQLVDDGGPYDDIAGDGVYGYVYDRINRPLERDLLLGHTWIFDLYASGFNNEGQAFERYQRLTYTPFLGREQTTLDSDGDGMLDNWEERFNATDWTVPDGDKDPDEDGLTNKEEHERGANPDDPDTDKGGETDGSETMQGQNPLFTADDNIPPITDFWTRNLSESVVLNFNPLPEYLRMRVYRGPTAAGPFSLVGTYNLPTMTLALNLPFHEPVFDPTKGQLLDEGLVNDVDYFYYLQPEGASGVVGAPSQVRRAEPAADPDQPEGAVLINNDDPVTTSPNVTLTLHALTTADGAQNVTHVQVSNHPDLTGVPWLPFAQEMTWILDPDPVTGLAFVHVRFRDGAGNVSDVIYGDGILVDEPTIMLPPWFFDLGWLLLDLTDPWFDGFTFTLTLLNLDDLDLGGGLQAATVNQQGEPLYFAGVAFDLQAENAAGLPVTQFDAPFTMTVYYEDWQWRSAGIGSEDSLNLYWINAGVLQPVLPCAGCSHDPTHNEIVAVLDHLTQFALFGEPAPPIYLPLVLR